MKNEIEGLKWVQRSCSLPANTGHGPAPYKWKSEMRRKWLRTAVDVLVQESPGAVSVGGLQGPPDVILPPPHTSWQKKLKNKMKQLGWAVVPLVFLLGESRGGRDQDKL